MEAFLVVDAILRQGIVGISEIVTKIGLVDISDVRTAMKDAGTALMGVETGIGKNRYRRGRLGNLKSPPEFLHQQS